MTAFLVVPGAVAYASFFSFFGDIFTKVNMQEKSINSQNIALLAAVVGPSAMFEPIPAEANTVADSALLPDSGPEGGLADVDNQVEGTGQVSIYVVREGDSLASIGKMFDVSINTILWANNLPRGTKLTIGQTLAILPVSGVKHTVKKGDTVSAIAKKYKGDVDEVRLYNGIDGDTLVVGGEIIVPDGEIAEVKIATRPASSKLRGGSSVIIDGYYRAPMSGYRKTQGLHGYNGVDLASYEGVGARVMAAAGGNVVIARQGGYNGGYGNYVVIQHANGTQTLYSHLKSVAVTSGESVGQGQVVGYMGNSGRSSGPHLHFEVRGARNPF